MPLSPTPPPAQPIAQPVGRPAQLPPEQLPATLANVADLLALPLFVLHPDATLCWCNAAGHSLLARPGAAWRLSSDGRVLPQAARKASAWAQALARAKVGESLLLRWDDLQGGAHAAHGVNAVVARLVPLRHSAANDEAPGQSPAPAQPAPSRWLLLAPQEHLAANPAALGDYATTHALSVAELRLLERLALGDSVSRAASSLGLAVGTVRTQAQAIRRKTGHASLAELLRDLQALPPLRRTPPAG